MTTPPSTTTLLALTDLARVALSEALCVLQSQRRNVESWFGALWSEVPPVKAWRDMAAALRALAMRADEVADRIEGLAGGSHHP